MFNLEIGYLHLQKRMAHRYMTCSLIQFAHTPHAHSQFMCLHVRSGYIRLGLLRLGVLGLCARSECVRLGVCKCVWWLWVSVLCAGVPFLFAGESLEKARNPELQNAFAETDAGIDLLENG